MQKIAIGTTYTSFLTVTTAHTAATLGSGNLPVLGTPAMAALMENAALEAVAPMLEAGESSVGTALNITHERASAVGETVSAIATVTAVEGRRIDFELCARNHAGETIGNGTHTRFVVNVEKFMSKVGK